MQAWQPDWESLCRCGERFFGEHVFSSSYLQSSVLAPSPTALATYIIPLFMWTAWLLSLYVTHAVSHQHISKYPKLVLLLQGFFVRGVGCCSSPKELFLSPTKNTGRKKKELLRWKRAPPPPPPSRARSIKELLVVHSQKADSFCLMRKQGIQPH